MKLAAEVLFETGKYIHLNHSIIEKARKELDKKVGEDFIYKPLLGDRNPPLNYREN